MKESTVIAVVGLPMTGKSTLGHALEKETGWHFIDIDEGPARCAPPQEIEPYRSDEVRARDRARMTVAYATLHAALRRTCMGDSPILWRQPILAITTKSYCRPQ